MLLLAETGPQCFQPSYQCDDLVRAQVAQLLVRHAYIMSGQLPDGQAHAHTCGPSAW